MTCRTILCAALLLPYTLARASEEPVADTPIDRALATLATSLEESPRDAGLLTDYGNLLVRAGRYDESRAAYENAIAAAPSASMPIYDLGLLELELGELRDAADLFRRALEHDPGFARAEYGLGSVFEARGRSRRAVKHYVRAFQLDPELLKVEHNPEILFSTLAAWASSKAYLEASVGRGTRLYANPQPIVSLLLPTAPEPGAEAAPAEEPAEEPVEAETQPAADSAD
jgi:tetratricopeptide (TPR) repeat protein